MSTRLLKALNAVEGFDLKRLLAKKERVFAIMGSSHAVCVAPSFGRRL